MSEDQNNTQGNIQEAKAEQAGDQVNENKPAAKASKAKGKQVKNTTKKPITLSAYVDKGKPKQKVTILPTETADVDPKLFAALKKNRSAMSFFDSGELVEV